MHPVLLEGLASWHTADLRATAGRRQVTARHDEPTLTIRQQAGWLLVQLGLRLVVRQAG